MKLAVALPDYFIPYYWLELKKRKYNLTSTAQTIQIIKWSKIQYVHMDLYNFLYIKLEINFIKTTTNSILRYSWKQIFAANSFIIYQKLIFYLIETKRQNHPPKSIWFYIHYQACHLIPFSSLIHQPQSCRFLNFVWYIF